MPLYVIRPPNPAPGFDWSYAVPGQYLEDIVSVTATLTTAPAGAVTAHDSSGNGFDGTYHGGNNTGWFQPGIVAGDLSLLTGTLLQGSKFWFSSPYAALQWAAGWSFACWVELPVMPAGAQPTLLRAPAVLPAFGTEIFLNSGPNGELTVASDLVGANTAAGVVPTDGTKCFICVTWDGATLTAYIDGAAVAWASITILPGVQPANLAPIACSTNGVVSNTQIYIDEWAVWAGAITAGDVAAMFAAASTSFPAYSAAVIATAPAIYYHLDDGALGEGRTPTVEITDGTYTTGRFPSGFPAAANIGAYQYTWSARQTANTQTANGITTSVSLPKLILPAGYTIGTYTPGLGGLDQWSDINIWWDSSLMDIANRPDPYDYPPGFKLLYQQDVNAPEGGRVIF